MQERVPDKVEAIYHLREAVERKVRAEVRLEHVDSAAARDELLDASLEMESKTQDAIEVCHACGRAHESEEAHERRARVSDRGDNVLDVDFRPQSGTSGS